jgi:outer membrane protein OmpA-like peptidoglycan-associated protein
MSDILFEIGKADLKQELKENLAEIAAILKNLLTESNVVVEGHTDNVGSAPTNKKLSEQRASGVMQYLIDRGVDKKRLKSVGYGLEKPIADNKTDEGRAKNRRVELVIKDK